MISKLPRWVWPCAWVLAFIAGMINVVGLLGFQHQAITHLTGNTSMLATALAAGDVSSLLYFAAIIGSFVLGTTLSAFIIRDSALQLGRRYGVALLLEAVLLVFAIPLLTRNSLGGLCAAACACGIQNAMTTTYTGAIIRTTHISGMVTDLGIFLGHALRRLPVDPRRLRLCILVISGFLCGGFGGAFAFRAFHFYTLVIPAAILFVAPVGCIIRCGHQNLASLDVSA